MAALPSPLDALAENPRGEDLARLVHSLAFSAFDEKRPVLSDGLGEAMERLKLTAADLDTAAGHVGGALELGSAAKPAARVLLGALLARGVSQSPPDGLSAEVHIAEALVWLAAHAGADALVYIDAVLPDKTEGLWRAIADVIERADDGALPVVGRAGAIVAAVALAGSPVASTTTLARSLSAKVKDPAVRALLAGPGESPREAAGNLPGEVAPGPHNPVMFTFLALTGLLFAARAARLAGKWILRYRAPAELRVEDSGVTVKTRTELLGRTLRERETHIPKGSLLLVRREVRYPRLPLYAGLFALALGSYFGVSVFVDGVRAGSPDLLGLGALFFALGVALDFALTHFLPARQGKCRVLVVPRKGRSLAVTNLDPALTDAALRRLRA
ncbi:MAG: hypothetical protein IPK82_31305 [Polyangiaceae bacterium]|nr:hypothetical protein [Polyangiaceae bacterium]